ncbi:MAG: PD-(D/E)XK nuclease family protein [Tenacibaculum sp.]
MQSFISDTLDAILKSTQKFENVVFILPSKRSRVFVKQTLKNKIKTGFLPQMYTIGSFVEEISGIKKADSVQLLFYFYSIYKKEEQKPDPFSKFSNWAPTLLQDFNQIDQQLVDTHKIFSYLGDIHRLRKWSLSETVKETKLIKDYFAFMENLDKLYRHFYTYLKNKKIGYQGLIFREACKEIDNFISLKAHCKYFFLGFNALNASEELIFQKMLNKGNTQIYWDIDKAFYNSKHQAGSFIRKYEKHWKYYQTESLQILSDNFLKIKNIQVIGASKNIMQIKYARGLLSKFSSYNNSALVLADESLLPVALNSLPADVAKSVNITMGYPLKDLPATGLITSIFKLFINRETLQEKEDQLFYYKDLIALLMQPSIYQLLYVKDKNFSDSLITELKLNKTSFISFKEIALFFAEIPSQIQRVVLNLFKPFTNIDDFLLRLISIISLLKEKFDKPEERYWLSFYRVLKQLQNIQYSFKYVQDLKTLQHFFLQFIELEKLSFKNQPLQGLQIMGLLETRALDFENLIITSVNEGVLPSRYSQNSFIPFDVKIKFGLPTYRDKDALYSYNFFRLLQRAKNIYLIYNTEQDKFGGGEKSRFIAQLQLLRDDILEKIISPQIVISKNKQREILKTDEVLEKLKELAKKGISPSALTHYLYNPLGFYKHKVLGIKEFEDVEENLAANTMGTAIHNTLDALYKPYQDKYINAETLTKMQKQAKQLMAHYLLKNYKNGNIKTGKNRLIFEVANRFVLNFLKREQALLKNEENTLKIIATEQSLEANIKLDQLNFPVKIQGQVDRIDQLNNIIRIIDYKTGITDSANLKIVDFSKIRELKYHKAIQVMLYAFLYTQNKQHNFLKPLEAGIISFKNLNKGFLKMNFSASYTNPDYSLNQERLDTFMQKVGEFIIEIFDPQTTFIEPTDLEY